MAEQSHGLTAAIAPVLGGMIGGLISAVALIAAANVSANGAREAQVEQIKGQLALQREQFRAQIILKAVDAPSEDDRIKNLQFLIQAGLLDDGDHKITALVAHKDKTPIPFIPTSSGVPVVALPDCARPITEAEWREFQRRYRIAQTGKFDAATQKALEAMEARCKTPYKPGLDFSDPRNSQYLPGL